MGDMSDGPFLALSGPLTDAVGPPSRHTGVGPIGRERG